jgi:hypothetical protein
VILRERIRVVRLSASFEVALPSSSENTLARRASEDPTKVQLQKAQATDLKEEHASTDAWRKRANAATPTPNL